MFIKVFKYIEFIVYISNGVNSSRQTKVSSLHFSALIPVVKIVTTVLATLRFPREETGFSLMLNHDALLELSVEVFASIALVHSNEHGVELVLCVFSGDIGVGRLASIVMEERHFSLFVI